MTKSTSQLNRLAMSQIITLVVKTMTNFSIQSQQRLILSRQILLSTEVLMQNRRIVT